MIKIPLLNQLRIRNYKNIANAKVDLGPFVLLVGPNGAGKSNFVDTLTFVADCLNHSIQLAFMNRGGISAVRRKSGGHPTNLSIGLRISFSSTETADYSFTIAAKPREAFHVTEEKCIIKSEINKIHEYVIINGTITKCSINISPSIVSDRLALTIFSGFPEFRPIFDFLTRIKKYNLRPERLRELQETDPSEGTSLSTDGSNAAAVLRRIWENKNSDKYRYERICNILSKIVPGTTSVKPKSMGTKETLEFFQNVGQKDKWRFDALNMSDGTLRALGILLAIYQTQAASILSIEEPESTIHPAVTDIIMDVLLAGTDRSQVIVTTHSPDILDNKKIKDDQILVVESKEGKAIITPLPQTTRNIIRERLYTPGELFRSNELRTDDTYYLKNNKQREIFSK